MCRLIAVEFAGSHKFFMSRMPSSMGIAGVEPHQLTPTVGMTGSGSTDLPAPSPTIANLTTPTRFDGSSSAMAVDSALPFDLNIDFDTSINIDIDTASTINVGIAVPAVIDTIPSKTEVDIARSTIIDTASPSVADLTPAATTIDPASSPTGAVSAVTGGFDMAFGLFNFHVDNDGVAELISVSDSTPPAADPSASPTIEGNPSMTTPLAPSEEEPRLETSTPSVGSNDFQDPPPSPTTAYCVECDAYHFVGAEDFSSHEIAGCEDPRGGTTGCERLSFLDVYSGYNQIRLKVEDEDKTAFITLHGVYCYMTMPFGLKNAGATYQRCMQACLKEQIGRNIKIYVDDIIIKCTKADSLLDEL
jgi:hypothetical protein